MVRRTTGNPPNQNAFLLLEGETCNPKLLEDWSLRRWGVGGSGGGVGRGLV